MRFCVIALAAAIGIFGVVACESAASDCSYAKSLFASNKTAQLGDSCTSGSYGQCASVFDNCQMGVCALPPSGQKVCLATCSSQADCTGDTFCRNGACFPGATCTTVCAPNDGGCCDYVRDPSDPTACTKTDCH